MKQILIFIIIIFISLSVFGQNIDSLKAVSKNKSGNEKVINYRLIGQYYQQQNKLDSANLFYYKALKNANSTLQNAEIYQLIGVVYFMKNDFLNTLENFKLSLNYAQKLGRDSVTARRYSDLGVVYDYLGAYDKSIENYYKALKIFEKRNDQIAISKIYNNIAIITQNRGKIDEAIELYKKSIKIRIKNKSPATEIANVYLNIGSAYEELKDFKKSLEYYFLAKNIYLKNKKNKSLSIIYRNVASVKLSANQLDSAFVYTQKSEKITVEIKDKYGIKRIYHLKGKIFGKQNQIDSSIYNLRKAYFWADTLKTLSDKAEILVDLVEIYKKKKDYNKALFYNEELLKIKDYLSNEKSNNKIETLKIIYETDKKEAKIISLHKNIKRNRILNIVEIVLLVLVALIILLIFRHKLIKSRYEKDLFNQRLLRLQMNPHFIFNALTSIQLFMFEKDTKKASLYLSSFSKLTRAILNNSRKEFITLQEDIETVDNYLKIQQMRFDNIYDYEIIVDENIDPDNIKLAPMLIQPFVENSVIHGFKDITYQGKISIEYKKLKNKLKIIIIDNGKGIENDKDKNQKSHAINITKERLSILNKSKRNQISFQVLKKKKQENNNGLTVVFNVPLIKKNIKNV